MEGSDLAGGTAFEYGASQCDSLDQVQVQKLYHKDGKCVMFEPQTGHANGCVVCEE